MLTHLPLSLSGQVYRSQMPFSNIYDPDQLIFEDYKSAGIQVVVMLTSDEEAKYRTGHDLRAVYQQANMEVIYLPIGDFGIPNPDDLHNAVFEAYEQASNGKNVAIHCHAGIGRTGMFTACLAQKALGLDGDQALKWTKEHIFGAVETPDQHELVINFQTD